MKFPLVIEYNNEDVMDGVGSQLLRILGVYGISRKYKLHYQHRSILNCNREELMGSEVDLSEFEALLSEINNLIKIDSDKHSRDFRTITSLNRKPGRKILFFYIVYSVLLSPFRIRLILRVTLPFGISDKTPHVYKFGAEVIRRSILLQYENQSLPCVLHYRTHLHSPEPNRATLNSKYYEETVHALIAKQLLCAKEVVIHADILQTDLIESKLNPKIQDLVSFCKNIAPVETIVKPNSPFLETFFDMIFAEVLIMGRSALSYVAGLLNTGIVAYPPSHGHPRLAHWVVGKDT